MGRELAAAEAALGQVEVNCCICRGTHLLGPIFFSLTIGLESEVERLLGWRLGSGSTVSRNSATQQ